MQRHKPPSRSHSKNGSCSACPTLFRGAVEIPVRAQKQPGNRVLALWCRAGEVMQHRESAAADFEDHAVAACSSELGCSVEIAVKSLGESHQLGIAPMSAVERR